MDKEILFRAKTKNSGRWAYGDLVTNKYKDRQGIHIYEKSDSPSCLSGYQFVRINKKTISQYIGLCDKNGTKIFEGDIVRDDARYDYYKVEFARIGFESGAGLTGYVTTDLDNCNLEFDSYINEEFRSADRNIKLDKIEIVGNIWDNPTFLEDMYKMRDGDDLEEK